MEKHDVLVMGEVANKRYYFSKYWHTIEYSGDFVEHNELWSGELENPPLEVGDYLYIAYLDKKVRINDKAKSTDGGYIYWSDHTEYIDDEKAEETRLIAEREKEEFDQWEKEQREQRKKEVKVESVEDTPVKKWYQFWK